MYEEKPEEISAEKSEDMTEPRQSSSRRKTVAIVSKPDRPELADALPPLEKWLQQRNYAVVVDQESAAYFPASTVVARSELAARSPDLALVLGGDGTLLSAARAVAHRMLPIIAVNLGSLGFLTEVSLLDLYTTLEAVDHGQCPMEQRSMLHCEVVREGEPLAAFEALNDAVVNKGALARLVSFDLYIDHHFVSNYLADGVIVATPTGSTAYSLAAGGPILTPSVDAFVVTPVCPHSLTHRPLVVRDTARMEVICRSVDREAFLSIDGQVGVPVGEGDSVVVSKSTHGVRMLRMRKTFFEVLRDKLKWGQR
jgi:NAD+ kinase